MTPEREEREQHRHVLRTGDRPSAVRRRGEVVEAEEPEHRRHYPGTEAARRRGGHHDREVREPLAQRRDVVERVENRDE